MRRATALLLLVAPAIACAQSSPAPAAKTHVVRCTGTTTVTTDAADNRFDKTETAAFNAKLQVTEGVEVVILDGPLTIPHRIPAAARTQQSDPDFMSFGTGTTALSIDKREGTLSLTQFNFGTMPSDRFSFGTSYSTTTETKATCSKAQESDAFK